MDGSGIKTSIFCAGGGKLIVITSLMRGCQMSSLLISELSVELLASWKKEVSSVSINIC